VIPTGLLPEGVNWCIAGGWAACPALALDKDVWIIEPLGSDLSEVRQNVLNHLKQYFGDDYEERVQELDETRAEDIERYIPGTGLNGAEVHIVRVARLYTNGWEHHIIVTDAGTVKALLDTFDISTHAIAICPGGDLEHGVEWTPVTEPPRELRSTPTTAERMKKIAARYGHEKESIFG
jgi:hypothetical protein